LPYLSQLTFIFDSSNFYIFFINSIKNLHFIALECHKDLTITAGSI
jgi:hypothetical protein